MRNPVELAEIPHQSDLADPAPNPPGPARPELLAPAGDAACLAAAIENGADAVYFGLQSHNARIRAANFHLDDLPETMARLHQRNMRGYVTLNTLIFPRELPDVEIVIKRLAQAGVDAVIVQDLGLCRLIRAICPELEIHASTQMTIASAAGVKLAQELGCSRVILARELALAEIARIRSEVDLPVEVFVHGALCVAYSGQCLTSEALGGRSANRGECAQACRMPYQIICDGREVDLGTTQYLLSPQDLAAYDLVPQLVALGVASLKIEGRLKTPEYVANITRHYRAAIDAALTGQSISWSPDSVREMEMSFSRGFSHGFLDGNNHKRLVRGDYAKKRGVYLGHVLDVQGSRVRVTLHAPLKPGDGVVFDAIEAEAVPEQGGRVYGVFPPGRRRTAYVQANGGLETGIALLEFGRHDLDPLQLVPGQRLWKTDDPELTRRLRASFEGPPRRRVPLDLEIHAATGEPLVLVGRTDRGLSARLESEHPLTRAEKHSATVALLREQLDRLGGTVYQLRSLVPHIEGHPLVPKSLLNQMRRALVARLDELAAAIPPRSIANADILPALRERMLTQLPSPVSSERLATRFAALVRSQAQAEAALRSGVRTIYLELQHLQEYRRAVPALRQLAPEPFALYLTTPRVEKPGEESLIRYVARQKGDGILVRHAGALAFCSALGIPFVADFSLNTANELTAAWLLAKGAQRVTASYDLSLRELSDLLQAVPRGRVEVVVHQHMPMFHMEHCVYCAFLSPGTDKSNCGRPCDRHDVRLRDRVGMEHPLQADIGCRNTLFNAVPQSAAEFLPRLVELGVQSLRIEFLDESPDQVERTLALYQETLRGERDPRTLWRALQASNQYGVTRGQLVVL
jgi:putative protease